MNGKRSFAFMTYFSSPSAFNEKINQWFNGLIALPLLAVSFAYLEISTGRFDGLIADSFYLDISIIVTAIIAIVLLTRRYRKQIGYIPVEKTLGEKVMDYFLFSKTYYLLMFLLGMITTICIFVFGSTSFAGLYAFQLFVLSLHRPTLLSVANKLNLKGDIRGNFLKKDIFDN